jgi:DNA (cytosine-5)-methyltransferase 1
MSMTVGSLFSGIGGLDLGLERAGMRVVWQSEIDPYACRVLAKHWPDVPNLGDITTIDWSTVEPVDLICGGYPCQPFSLAGVRRGDTDPRHLWPHFANAIRLLRPRWALLENVPGHLSLGFGRVLGDLAELGYDTDWDCIPAAAVGAPHLRYRIFVVAYSQDSARRRGSIGRQGRNGRSGVHGAARDAAYADRESESGQPVDAVTRRRFVVPDRAEQRRALADTGGGRGSDDELRTGRDVVGVRGAELADAERSRLEGQPRTRVGLSLAPESDQEFGRQWAVEPDVGRVADGVPNRVDRLRALGNAVVPQVAEYVGRRIVEVSA